jgi:hypothetical protein
MRAGDIVFTSAHGDHGYNPVDVVYDKRGLIGARAVPSW